MLSYALRCYLLKCADGYIKMSLGDSKKEGYHQGIRDGIFQFLEHYKGSLFFVHQGHQASYPEGPYYEYTDFDGRGGFKTETVYLTPQEHLAVVNRLCGFNIPLDIEPNTYGPQGQYGFPDRPFALASYPPGTQGSVPPGTLPGWQ